MKGAVIVVWLAAAASAKAQQPSLESLRARVVGDSAGALAAAVRRRPDDARELLRRLLVDAGPARSAAAESTLVLAHRIAVA